ncbi:MAG: SPASM domain-containing protein [Anaerolinea sp.]|nr:SPASM domain-containing protein [Anaerolinea sp.]
MNSKQTFWAEVDADGRLSLPPEIAHQYGLTPGARARLDVGSSDIRLHRPVTHLAKIYIEPTNRCNIECRTCMRNNWDVELGQMSADTFAAFLTGLRRLERPPLVFFGGIGEPLAHPHTPEMIAQVKATGATVEMISNGTLLNEKRSRQLIAAGLDALWVSIDGARPESYADVRLGAELPNVLANLSRFRKLRPPSHKPQPAIGIAFVAMKRNIADLPEVMAIGRRLGAARFMVSNLLPHTAEMVDEILYENTLNDITYLPSPWLRSVSIPKMEFNELTSGPLLAAMSSGYNVSFAGSNLGVANDVCTFIENGSLAIGWDGRIAPCPPLLYNHTGYLRGYERASHAHILGNIKEHDLLTLWLDPEYVAYRERVHRFAFAPCTSCGGCDDSHANDTDCFDSPAPACGGCLWAQAVIQCP